MVLMNKILLICLVGLIVAFIAVTIFKVPLNSIFLFGVILLCPLMHVFMMGGKHDHGSDKESASHH